MARLCWPVSEAGWTLIRLVEPSGGSRLTVRTLVGLVEWSGSAAADVHSRVLAELVGGYTSHWW